MSDTDKEIERIVEQACGSISQSPDCACELCERVRSSMRAARLGYAAGMRAAANAVCEGCREGWEFADGEHRIPIPCARIWRPCEAAAIRTLAQFEGNKPDSANSA